MKLKVNEFLKMNIYLIVGKSLALEVISAASEESRSTNSKTCHTSFLGPSNVFFAIVIHYKKCCIDELRLQINNFGLHFIWCLKICSSKMKK